MSKKCLINDFYSSEPVAEVASTIVTELHPTAIPWQVSTAILPAVTVVWIVIIVKLGKIYTRQQVKRYHHRQDRIIRHFVAKKRWMNLVIGTITVAAMVAVSKETVASSLLTMLIPRLTVTIRRDIIIIIIIIIRLISSRSNIGTEAEKR